MKTKNKLNESREFVVIDPRGNARPVGMKIQGQQYVKKMGGPRKGYHLVLKKNAMKARRAIEKNGGNATNTKIQDIMWDLLYETVNESAELQKVIKLYQDLQLKQQKLQMAFTGTSDPKERAKIKKALIKMGPSFRKAEADIEKLDEGKLTEANQYKDVSNKFKNALDVLPEKYFNRKGVLALIKKLKEKNPEAAMAYTMDAFGWMSGMKEK